MPSPPRSNPSAPPEAPAECPQCFGYGYILDSNPSQVCPCGIKARREVMARRTAAGIPPRFQEKSLANFRAPRGDREREAIRSVADSYARSFHPEESPGFVLRGITGCGKTHIAVGILRGVLERGFSGYYCNFVDLLANIRASYDPDHPDSEDSLLEPLEKVDLLVLDDVGAESATDWVRDRLYLIINRRYEFKRPTVITTNCDEAELNARIGPRTASRLREMCTDDFPAFPRQDYRKAAMK